MAIDSNQQNPTYLKGTSTYLHWAYNDLGGSAIIAKILESSGYITYRSELSLQWRSVSISNATSDSGVYSSWQTFPVSFPTATLKVYLSRSGIPSADGLIFSIGNATKTGATVYLSKQPSTLTGGVFYGQILAIGY